MADGAKDSERADAESAHEHAEEGNVNDSIGQAFELVLLIPTQQFCQLPRSTEPNADGYLELPLPSQASDPVHELKTIITDAPEGLWLGSFGLKPVVAERVDVPSADIDDESGAAEPQWGPWTDLAPPPEATPEPGVINAEAWRLTNEGVLGDYADLSAVFTGDFERKRRGLKVVPTSYSALSMNQHLIRVRDTLFSQLSALSAHNTYDPTSLAIASGSTVYPSVRGKAPSELTPAVKSEDGDSGKGKGKSKDADAMPAPLSESNHPFVDFHLEDLKPEALYSHIKPAASTSVTSPCVKSLGISPWSPPPHARRLRGDFVYVTVSTLEGESYHITGATNGFWVSKMTANVFDPSPRASLPSKARPGPYNSLFELLSALSPQFSKALATLVQTHQHTGSPDVYLTIPISHYVPTAPWLVHTPQHAADPFRTQIAYLLTSATSADVLPPARDWNDEYAQSKEMPQASVAERLMRERLQSRVRADFISAATKTAMSIARGDIPPLNPNEAPEAHTWVHNNMLFTRAEDAIGAYAHVGGNEASRYAASKDLRGIDMLERLDVDGVHSMATVVIDYLGERWVAQSLIPGLFKTKDDEGLEGPLETDGEDVKKQVKEAIANDKPWPSEATPSKDDYPPAGSFRIVYGSAVPEAPDDKVRSSAYFHKLAEKVAKQMRFAEHTVKDAAGKQTKLWTSTDMHGIAAPDGRSYFIDCFRMHCVDIEWIEKSIDGEVASDKSGEQANGVDAPRSYPHRLAFLRQELLSQYHDAQLKKWLEQRVQETRDRVEKENADKGATAAEPAADSVESELKEAAQDPAAEAEGDSADAKVPTSVINAEDFVLLFNPDAFVERKPTDGSEAVVIYDAEEESTKNVRLASQYLRDTALMSFVSEVAVAGNFITDGFLLSKLMHRKGINMRYLGALAEKIDSGGDKIELRRDYSKEQVAESLKTLKLIIQLEMVIRSSKHILNRLLRTAQPYEQSHVIAHFLNCLLGSSFQPKPVAEVPDTGSGASIEREWTSLTPAALREQIVAESQARFRYTLPASIFGDNMVHRKVLRELCMRVGAQLVAREYKFAASTAGTEVAVASSGEEDKKDSTQQPATTAGGGKKKKGKGSKAAAAASTEGPKRVELPPTTFKPDDVLNIAPVVKSGSTKSLIADESFELAQRSFSQGQVDLGAEQAQDSLQLCEQVLGSVHPDASLKYHDLAILYHSLANSLARKVQYHYVAQNALKDPETVAENRERLEGLVLEDVDAVRVQQEHYLLASVRAARQGVIIAERTFGLDSPEAIQQYTDLGLLEQLVGNTEAGLKFTKHAMTLWANVYGTENAGIFALLNTAITMIQSDFTPLAAVPLLEEASKLSERVFGPESIGYSSAQQAIGQAYATNRDFEKALPYMQTSLKIMEKSLPTDSKDVTDTKMLVDVITDQMARQGAEKQAREERLKRKFPKLMNDGSLRARMTSNSRLRNGAVGGSSSQGGGVEAALESTAAAASSAAKPKAAHGQKGDLSLDELVDYIQGKSSGKAGGSSKARKRKTSPPS